ncbi:outer membrane beta-barrel protein [Yoonia sp. SS1-5]|uniref:Outer membrane protein n=1 Tax=Yoonia rhodophyticola TaxID=3137370 RepID=A0AAN0M7U8_9RHOB
MKTSLILALTLSAAAPTTALADWNGWYAGLSAGSVSDNEFVITSGTTGAQADLNDSSNFGGFIGHLNQSGSAVFGGEIEISTIDELTGSDPAAPVTVELDTLVIDVKAKAGFAVDNILAYGVLGISAYSFENSLLADDFQQTGLSYGAGIDFKLSDSFFIGAEYLSRNPSGITPVAGTNLQAEHESSVNSISIRAGMTF